MTTVGLQRDIAGPDASVSPRLPDMIDGWVRDGLLSAHAAMKVFRHDFGEPGAGDLATTTTTRGRRMEVSGYFGAGVIALGGVLMLFDDGVDLGTRFLVGVLIMIAMRHTMRPMPTSRRWDSTRTAPRHRDVRQTVRRNRS